MLETTLHKDISVFSSPEEVMPVASTNLEVLAEEATEGYRDYEDVTRTEPQAFGRESFMTNDRSISSGDSIVFSMAPEGKCRVDNKGNHTLLVQKKGSLIREAVAKGSGAEVKDGDQVFVNNGTIKMKVRAIDAGFRVFYKQDKTVIKQEIRSPHEQDMRKKENEYEQLFNLKQAENLQQIKIEEMQLGFTAFYRLTNGFSIGSGATATEDPKEVFTDPKDELIAGNALEFFIVNGQYSLHSNQPGLTVKRVGEVQPAEPPLHGNTLLKEQDVIKVGGIEIKFRQVGDEAYLCVRQAK